MKLRSDLKQKRRDEAAARQAECDKLSPEERLARLDKLFGKGEGAKRERARLLARIEKSNLTQISEEE